MRHAMLMTATACAVFAFGMTASMAQERMDPGKIRVNPPAQTSTPPVQTAPAPIPNLNTSKNPYQNRTMETPVQPRK